jgi:signal transduction histidine kinase
MELSAQEKQRMDKLSTDDQLKLKAIMQMMAKEKDAIEKDARKAKGMMEDDEPKIVNSLKNLIINALKKVHQGAYRDDIYDSFYTELMQNVDAGRVELDGLDVEDEFDNFISVNMDNVSLREVLD